MRAGLALLLLLALQRLNHAFAVAIHGRETSDPNWLLVQRSPGTSACSLRQVYDFSSRLRTTSSRSRQTPPRGPLDLLPIGISFYTFEAISYIVDVYRGRLQPERSLANFLLFILFFPHLVAGPIVRPGELIPQLSSPRDPRYVDTSRAFFLIGTGLFMKVVIANHLAANIVDEVFGAPNQHSSLEVLVGIYAYAVQIYADFFGYTNIAIGIASARLHSHRTSTRQIATSITDFGAGAHALSRWLRDYCHPRGQPRRQPAHLRNRC